MATNKPPAGTTTHKPVCACIQCKAKRYDLLLTERDALKTELAGYAAELKTITAEANLQRKTADDAKAELESLKTTYARFEANTGAAYQDAMERERRAGWVETWTVGIVVAVLSGLAFFLIGRAGR